MGKQLNGTLVRFHAKRGPRAQSSRDILRAAEVQVRAARLQRRRETIGNVHFQSRSDEWATPRELFERLDREFHFTLDPCSTHANSKCRKHFTRAEDGLLQDWSQDVVFMNPPYGREIARWMQKAFESAQAGATVVCLVQARTDTRWWHQFAIQGDIIFFKGRLRFGDAKASAPFPSALVKFPKSGARAGDGQATR